MVSVLAFYSNDPSSNPAGYLNFLYKKTKINEKEAGGWPIFKKTKLSPSWQTTSIEVFCAQQQLSLKHLSLEHSSQNS